MCVYCIYCIHMLHILHSRNLSLILEQVKIIHSYEITLWSADLITSCMKNYCCCLFWGKSPRLWTCTLWSSLACWWCRRSLFHISCGGETPASQTGEQLGPSPAWHGESVCVWNTTSQPWHALRWASGTLRCVFPSTHAQWKGCVHPEFSQSICRAPESLGNWICVQWLWSWSMKLLTALSTAAWASGELPAQPLCCGHEFVWGLWVCMAALGKIPSHKGLQLCAGQQAASFIRPQFHL